MRRVLVVASLLGTSVLLACGGGASPRQPSDQLAFGVSMAQQGLWSEAYFRFQQAARLGGDDARIYNNLAVAAEALGRFDEALDHYQRALRLEPGNRDLRSNYDRFSSFYESFRARSEEDPPAAPEGEPAGESTGPETGAGPGEGPDEGGTR